MKEHTLLISNTKIQLPDSNAELEARLLTLEKAHNALIDLLKSKGLI